MATDDLIYMCKLRERKQKLLRALQLQAAKYGMATPAHISAEISDLEQELKDLDRQIEQLSLSATPADSAAPGRGLRVGSLLTALIALTVVGVLIVIVALVRPRTNGGAPSAAAPTPVSSSATPAPVAATTSASPSQVPTLTQATATVAQAPTTAAPAWAHATPTPALPKELLFLQSGIADCAGDLDLNQQITAGLTDLAQLGYTLEIKPIAAADAIVEARRLHARLLVQAACAASQKPALAVALVAPPALPIALLREPESITITADTPQMQIFVQAMALYTAGRYQAALRTLEGQAAALGQAAERGSFNWLWGNLLLRNERWAAAAAAYSAALEQIGEPPPAADRAALLGNRGLARLLQRLAEVGAAEQCSDGARRDLEEALQLEPSRSDGHILLGEIFLYCPREGQGDDIEVRAGREVQLALDLAPDDPRAWDVHAQVGLENSAIPDVGDPLIVEKYACRALELDPSLPGPQRTLGIIYARHGLADLARAHFKSYALAADFAWQRREALDRWQNADQAEQTAPPGLGACSR